MQLIKYESHEEPSTKPEGLKFETTGATGGKNITKYESHEEPSTKPEGLKFE